MDDEDKLSEKRNEFLMDYLLKSDVTEKSLKKSLKNVPNPKPNM